MSHLRFKNATLVFPNDTWACNNDHNNYLQLKSEEKKKKNENMNREIKD
jgi:trehalose-6-phosphate synthase